MYLRDTAPINFDIGLLIKKINKIDPFYLKDIKKFIFIRQERLGEKKASQKNGTIFVSNEIYDLDRCFSSILKEISYLYYRSNEASIILRLKGDFLSKKVDFYYDVVLNPSKVPLCDFLHEGRSKNFELLVEKNDEIAVEKAANKHFLEKSSIFSIEEYFSDCFVGFYQKRKTKIKHKHKSAYKIIKNALSQEKT